MALPHQQRVAVRRLRIRDGRSDAITARLHTERALAAVDLRPHALPPGAVLLVRSLQARIGEAPAALDELLRSAARPARQTTPAAAKAVVFASEAELLACLAEDSASGTAWGSWWRALVAPDPTTRGAVAAWLADPEAVPAAFSILAARGHAVEFASTLDDAQAEQLTTEVARVHGVTPASVERAPPTSQIAGPASGNRTQQDRSAGGDLPTEDAAPLTVAQTRLLSLSLSLNRAPATVHGGETSTPPAPDQSEPQPSNARPDDLPDFTLKPRAPQRETGRTVAGDSSAAAPAATDPPDAESATPEQPKPRRQAPRTPSAVAPPNRHPDDDHLPPPTASPAAHAGLPPRSRPEPNARTADATRPGQSLETSSPTSASKAPSPEPTPLAWQPPVATDLGGLLFLIGVAQRLGYYADFSEPAAPALALDPWRFVALVGARLTNRDDQGNDPLWALLAELARDESEPPPERELDAYTTAVRSWLETHVDLPIQDVLGLPALVYANDLRVDAVYALIRHPIEIRLAGIDIDPGWIPAAGRALYFHFE
jgi:hypothetical protein